MSDLKRSAKAMIRHTAILLAVLTVSHAASWDDLPLAYGLREVDSTAVEKDFESLHPWKPSAELPLSFKDAGLESPVRLVACDLYFDGGSRFYLFRGMNGKFLVLCTDAVDYYSNETKKKVPVDKPRLFLGTFHFSNEPRVVVTVDSPTERFLVAAIKAEVSRITAEKSKMTEKPNQSPEPTAPSGRGSP